MDPARFDEMRPGCFDIHARVADMDINGIWASLCFPSLVAGFCGSVFSRADDPELGLACVRAWNEWHLEVVGRAPTPSGSFPCSCRGSPTWPWPPTRCGATPSTGFKAVSFPEFPAQLGLPSIFSGHWDPVLRRLRGDRDGRVPAHRGLGVGPAAVARSRPSSCSRRCSR